VDEAAGINYFIEAWKALRSIMKSILVEVEEKEYEEKYKQNGIVSLFRPKPCL